jgi:carbon-monoxide dehydrogenase medium subunit
MKQLCEALKKKDSNTFIIGGGTDLIIHLRKKEIYDFKIIDITKIKKLKKIEDQKDKIIIGACVTMTELENSSIIKKYVSSLSEAAAKVGSTQIRNRATIGGNIANASQSADTLPVIFAYDADLEIINSKNMIRTEKAINIVEGLEKNNLEDDEIVVGIIIDKVSSKSAFEKVGARNSVTISKVNCCVKIDMDKEKNITNASVFLGAVGVKPIEGFLIEKELIGRNIREINISDFKDTIRDQIEEAIPNRASKKYKKEAAIGIIDEILKKLKDQ